MNVTQALNLNLEEIVLQVIEKNPERIKACLEKVGFSMKPIKRNLTTKEMCESLGINYNTWMNSEVKNDPRIVALRDSSSAKTMLYPTSSLDTIYEIWKERKR